MNEEDNHLRQQAVKLDALGVEVERARTELKNLVKQNHPYASPGMRAALEKFDKANTEWKHLEAEHLALKEFLGECEEAEE